METIAVYWEAKIKTYGFTLCRRQTLVRVCMSADKLETCGHLFEDLAQSFSSFQAAFMSMGADGSPVLGFLFEKDNGQGFLRSLAETAGVHPEIQVTATSPLDTVSFYGPHFQDRFGIVHAAGDALATAGLAPLVTVCSGSTAWLVLPDGTGDAAVTSLRKAFRIPGDRD